MNLRSLALPLLALVLGLNSLHAADAAKGATKPGYNVILDVNFDEKAEVKSFKVVESDDPTGDEVLTQIALHLATEIKQKPQIKDGKAVPFTTRVPFNFPVAGDEGPAANDAPRPSVRQAQQPIYPESLAAQEASGGAILELQIGAYGNVQNVKVMRASHQEFADSAAAAVKTWIFAPAMQNGVPVESRWRIAIAFSYHGKNVEWKWRVAPRPSLGNYTVVRPSKDLPKDAKPETAPAGAAK